jgi:hypothetical protein
LERELWWREHHNALVAEVAMPTYLRDVVGERPGKPSERAAWQEAVRAIESYRSRWGITDQESALGRGSVPGAHDRERETLSRRLRQGTEQTQQREVDSIERSIEL